MADVTFPDKVFAAALGPIKLEIVSLTSVSDGETFTSRLQNPQWSWAFSQGDRGATADTVSTAISDRTVTIHDPVGSSYLVLIGGY